MIVRWEKSKGSSTRRFKLEHMHKDSVSGNEEDNMKQKEKKKENNGNNCKGNETEGDDKLELGKNEEDEELMNIWN